MAARPKVLRFLLNKKVKVDLKKLIDFITISPYGGSDVDHEDLQLENFLELLPYFPSKHKHPTRLKMIRSAFWNDNPTIVSHLLEIWDLEFTDISKDKLLRQAIINHKPRIVAFLIKRGFEIDESGLSEKEQLAIFNLSVMRLNFRMMEFFTSELDFTFGSLNLGKEVLERLMMLAFDNGSDVVYRTIRRELDLDSDDEKQNGEGDDEDDDMKL